MLSLLYGGFILSCPNRRRVLLCPCRLSTDGLVAPGLPPSHHSMAGPTSSSRTWTFPHASRRPSFVTRAILTSCNDLITNTKLIFVTFCCGSAYVFVVETTAPAHWEPQDFGVVTAPLDYSTTELTPDNSMSTSVSHTADPFYPSHPRQLQQYLGVHTSGRTRLTRTLTWRQFARRRKALLCSRWRPATQLTMAEKVALWPQHSSIGTYFQQGHHGTTSSLSTFTSAISRFLTQAELQVWEMTLGIPGGPLHRYYTVSTDLPLTTPFLRMWTGRGRGLYHPLPTVLLLSGPLGLAIPLYPR